MYELFLDDLFCPFQVNYDKPLNLIKDTLLTNLSKLDFPDVIKTAKSIVGYKEFNPEATTYNLETESFNAWIGRFSFQRGMTLAYMLLPKQREFPMSGMSKFDRSIRIYTNYLENERVIRYITQDWLDSTIEFQRKVKK